MLLELRIHKYFSSGDCFWYSSCLLHLNRSWDTCFKGWGWPTSDLDPGRLVHHHRDDRHHRRRQLRSSLFRGGCRCWCWGPGLVESCVTLSLYYPVFCYFVFLLPFQFLRHGRLTRSRGISLLPPNCFTSSGITLTEESLIRWISSCMSSIC